MLQILTAHRSAEERRTNASPGEIPKEVRGGGISPVFVGFGAVVSRRREASEEEVGLVALKMLAQPISGITPFPMLGG